jgi:hypothetical protein
MPYLTSAVSLLRTSASDINLQGWCLQLQHQVPAAVLQLTSPVVFHSICLQDYSGFTRWESLYGATTASSDVVVSGNVVLHGCAQPGSSVAVRSITVLPGATVRPLWFWGGAASVDCHVALITTTWKGQRAWGEAAMC